MGGKDGWLVDSSRGWVVGAWAFNRVCRSATSNTATIASEIAEYVYTYFCMTMFGICLDALPTISSKSSRWWFLFA